MTTPRDLEKRLADLGDYLPQELVRARVALQAALPWPEGDWRRVEGLPADLPRKAIEAGARLVLDLAEMAALDGDGALP